MNSSRMPGMFPYRTTLLVLTLGSAALLGWLGHPASAVAGFASGGRSVDGPVVHPCHCDTNSPPHHPARPQKTRPDPTPEDGGQPLAANLDYQGPVWVIQGALSACAMHWLIDSSSPAWSEPAQHALLLLQVTQRFRC
jgi:hypothetical protein